MLNKSQKSYLDQNSSLDIDQLAKDTGASIRQIRDYLKKINSNSKKDDKNPPESSPPNPNPHMQSILKQNTNKRYGVVVSSEAMSAVSDAVRTKSKINKNMSRFIHYPLGKDKKSK